MTDQREILQLKRKYCHRIDTQQYGDWCDLFTETGTFDTGTGEPFTGRDDLYEFATDIFDEGYEYTAHLVSNPVIDIDGGTAIGTWYLILLYEQADGQSGWRQGWYVDEFRKVDSEWGIESVAVSYGAAGDLPELTTDV
jgi:hypothetical protein